MDDQTSATELSDEGRREVALLARVCDKDELAFEALYGVYYCRLHRFIFRVTGPDCSPPELINEVMHVVWNKANTYDYSSKVSTWIFGIAVRIAKKHVAERAGHLKRQKLLLGQGDDERYCDWELQIESEDWLEKGLARLSPEQRAVVELTYYQGLHYCEIAQILGCPENTVKTRMFYSRAILKKALRKHASAR